MNHVSWSLQIYLSWDFLQLGHSYFYVNQTLNSPNIFESTYFFLYKPANRIQWIIFSRMIFADKLVQKCTQQGIPLFSSALLSRSPLLLPLPPRLFHHHPIPFKLLHWRSPFLLEYFSFTSALLHCLPPLHINTQLLLKELSKHFLNIINRSASLVNTP